SRSIPPSWSAPDAGPLMARKIIRPLERPAQAPNPGLAGVRPQRVAVYVRVSSEEQLDGYSLDAQMRAARAYCEDRGWEITATYPEEGRSARYEDLNRRPAGRRLGGRTRRASPCR